MQNELRKGLSFYNLFFLPVGGLIIAGLYKLCRLKDDPGTNMIISSVRSDRHVPIVIAPLIFVSTVITHLVGGSAGLRVPPCSLGGSIGAKIGELFKLDRKRHEPCDNVRNERSFLFAFRYSDYCRFFAMGVISVGVIYYAGLVPCIASAFGGI